MGDTDITCAAGTIRGRTRGGVREFASVPYLAPAGAFDDPVPLEQGMRIDATAPHPNALSLITPLGARPGADCPVVVWLTAPAGQDLDTVSFVHVHVPHRTGFEGFLPFPADPIAHFRGVADTAVALSWIQRNIEAFGGDPTNVTVAGAGADAAVALWLCRRDHYAGEFRRAWAADPVFPRAPYATRKWAVRALLSAPLTRAKLNELAETHQAGWSEATVDTRASSARLARTLGTTPSWQTSWTSASRMGSTPGRSRGLPASCSGCP